MKANQGLRPVTTGTTFMLTVALMYTVCTAAWIIWHQGALDFLNALLHGLDFRRIEAQFSPTVGMYFYALFVMAAWAFVSGTLFALVHNLLTRNRSA